MKKEVLGNVQHFDPGVNSLKTFNMADSMELSNSHNDKIIQVYFSEITSSTSYFTDQNISLDKTIHSTDCIELFPIS